MWFGETRNTAVNRLAGHVMVGCVRKTLPKGSQGEGNRERVFAGELW